MLQMHLGQLLDALCKPGVTYKASESFTKNKERIQKFQETGDLGYIYQNQLDKACFPRDMFMEILRIYAKEQLLIK